jgi:hypothetical protein
MAAIQYSEPAQNPLADGDETRYSLVGYHSSSENKAHPLRVAIVVPLRAVSTSGVPSERMSTAGPKPALTQTKFDLSRTLHTIGHVTTSLAEAGTSGSISKTRHLEKEEARQSATKGLDKNRSEPLPARGRGRGRRRRRRGGENVVPRVAAEPLSPVGGRRVDLRAGDGPRRSPGDQASVRTMPGMVRMKSAP